MTARRRAPCLGPVISFQRAAVAVVAGTVRMSAPHEGGVWDAACGLLVDSQQIRWQKPWHTHEGGVQMICWPASRPGADRVSGHKIAKWQEKLRRTRKGGVCPAADDLLANLLPRRGAALLPVLGPLCACSLRVQGLSLISGTSYGVDRHTKHERAAPLPLLGLLRACTTTGCIGDGRTYGGNTDVSTRIKHEERCCAALLPVNPKPLTRLRARMRTTLC